MLPTPLRRNSRQGSAHKPVEENLVSDPDLRYPLISLATASRIEDVSPAASGRATSVRARLISDDDDALVALLHDQLRNGGCAVVIRNTVARAQHAYELLSERLDVDVSLAHARFLACDRARIDGELLRRYGKLGAPAGRTGVVVATQVVEQSLDVDFDLMVTDIAPIDLVLQRVGRLHRHHRGDGESNRPEGLREARLFITGVMPGVAPDGPPRFASGLENVYERYLLMRSLAALDVVDGHESQFVVPDDIARLVQSVYGERLICPVSWHEGKNGERAARRKLDDDRRKSEQAAQSLRIFAPQKERYAFDLGDWLDLGVPDPDSPGTSQQQIVRAGVREGDDSFEVIVLQRDSDGNLQLPRWGGFSSSGALPSGIGAPDRQQVRDILSCTISLGTSTLRHLNIDAVIAALESSVPEQWHVWQAQDRNLAGQLLVALDAAGDARYDVTYRDAKNNETITKKVSFHYSVEKGWQTHVEQ